MFLFQYLLRLGSRDLIGPVHKVISSQHLDTAQWEAEVFLGTTDTFSFSLVAKSCLTLATPRTVASPHGLLLCPWDFWGKNTDTLGHGYLSLPGSVWEYYEYIPFSPNPNCVHVPTQFSLSLIPTTPLKESVIWTSEFRKKKKKKSILKQLWLK